MEMTADVLRQKVEERKAAEAAIKEEGRLKREAESAEWHQKTLKKIDRILEGEFGEYLLRIASKGYDVLVQRDGNSIWRNTKSGKEDHQYGSGVYLSFDLDEESETGKRFGEVLRAAGYPVKFVKHEYQNTTGRATADGYEIEDAPGTHWEHWVEITLIQDQPMATNPPPPSPTHSQGQPSSPPPPPSRGPETSKAEQPTVEAQGEDTTVFGYIAAAFLGSVVGTQDDA